MSGYRASCRRPRQNGQSLVEFAVALPVLLLLALAILQFALYVHAQNVVTTACAEGAIVAAAGNGTVGDGVATAYSVIKAGLGESSGGLTVRATAGGSTVTVAASGGMPVLLLGPAVQLRLSAQSVMVKEE